jgi:hypothetical protein
MGSRDVHGRFDPSRDRSARFLRSEAKGHEERIVAVLAEKEAVSWQSNAGSVRMGT